MVLLSGEVLLSSQKEYEERADYIQYEDLERWTVQSEFFRRIYKKIIQRGAKLIVGPRGTGKTHQMKFAYYKCLQDKKLPLALYVSFNRYYRLEPFLYKAPNAIKIFHTWVLCKVLLSCYQFLSDVGKADKKPFDVNSILSKNNLEKFVSQVEKSESHDWHNEVITNATIHQIIITVEGLETEFERKRTILLLDDAALNFAPDYMVEFFDVFRSLKTTSIAPKASVYPGSTEYGPRFHIGHDAEKVKCWLDIEDEGYSQFMTDLIEKRLTISKHDEIPKDIIELLKYASFGVPRTFISLIRNFISTKGSTVQQRFNKVIDEQNQLVKDEYLSLHQKIPKYKDIIQTGFELYDKITDAIVEDNKKNIQEDKKQIQIGILKNKDLKLNRMVIFLIEAGLLYELTPAKGYSGSEYNRYIPHLVFLIAKRAFSKGKGFNPKKIIQYINRKPKKRPVRRTFETLLGNEAIRNIHLNLPPCNNCGTERLTEEQKFCHQCGKELVSQSAFESCMRIPIDNLPITELQKERIKKQTDLRTLGDILSIPDPATELRRAYHIGKKRSEQIYETVIYLREEFLS